MTSGKKWSDRSSATANLSPAPDGRKRRSPVLLELSSGDAGEGRSPDGDRE
ncbi:hypothetical protein FRUB_07704 [Fimbriiglobus ruber]|uniref:Uncharacterized protein n=1 Tax=Fimbriiglobus ruber TaxID=1908690 RepID=A0A225DG15_9BACT|nr:hypothetical protein FRUB_07704 [Fimbriiglobus ruber]